ncbi:CDGSH iron-sulfur domain-containing protein [Nocardia sp. NBC_01327]|uniref:CDGSH iron-sulfur domain-containing protein n=1 Tax=Nocardia sp. NBC_01327 TaxID=2903593 RepID=UPI002E0E790A|nr:CDGSH iron-sulfur domain-containing protein [Nocardia sp. NBC_01327]
MPEEWARPEDTTSAAEPSRTRITFSPDGPALVEGPVELVRADGTTVCSDRFLVALCMCRRSKSFPLCDTSHRKRARRTAE